MPLDDSILQSVVCNVGNIGINYQQYISSNVVNVNIQSISLHDGSEQLIIKDDKTVSILSIESNIFGHCEDTEVIGNVVTVQIAELTLVYKPKVVVMIIAVLSTSHDEDKSYEKNYQERLQLQNNQKILSQITISMGKFRVICHNKISKLQFI